MKKIILLFAVAVLLHGLNAAGEPVQPNTADSVLTTIFDPANGAIRIENSGGGAGGTGLQPNTANSILATIFDPANTAIHVLCISGCGGGGSSTFQVNGVNTASQTLINFENGSGITVSSPSAGNVQFTLSASFSNISGTLADAQLPADAAKFTGTITANDCAKWSASGVLTDAGAACGSGGSMVYPAAGVPNSTGTAWGTSYQVGTAANDLVQLNASGQLPAVSAANLTNFPTLNQSTTGNAATATALAAVPTQCTSGQFATGIAASGNANCGTPAGGSGLTNWSQNGTTDAVTAQPASGQDATTLTILQSNAASPTADIFDICSNNAGACGTKYFWIGANGSLGFFANALSLGSANQATASYEQLYGGIGAAAYDQLLSPSLPTPAAPVPTHQAGGSLTAQTYSFKVAYNAGGTQQYTTAVSPSGSVTAVANDEIIVPNPPALAGATGWSLYEEDPGHGVWVIQGTYTTFSSVTLTSINYANVVTPPTANNTGAQFSTYISAAAGMSGEGCISGTVPGYDCAAGTWIARDPLLSLGDIPYGGAVNAEGFSPLARLTAPTTNGTYCVQEVVTASVSVAPAWGACGGGSSAISSLTGATANTSIPMSGFSLGLNWTGGLQTSWDTSGNLTLANTTASTSGGNTISAPLIFSSTYWNGTVGTNTNLFTVHSYVTSSGVATLSFGQSGPTDPTSYLFNGHYTGINNPLLTVNGDTAGSVIGMTVGNVLEGSIRASSSGNLILNAEGASSKVYLNYDAGGAGVIFSNGAGATEGSVDQNGAATFNSLTLATTPLAIASGGTGQSSIAFQTLTWVAAGTMTWTPGSGLVESAGPVAVTHATTSTLNLTGLVNGASYQIEFKQDATGGGTTTLNLGTGCTWMMLGSSDYAPATSETITPTASHVDMLAFTYDGTNCVGSFH